MILNYVVVVSEHTILYGRGKLLSSKFTSYFSFVEEIVICYIEVPFKIPTNFWALNFEELPKYFR